MKRLQLTEIARADLQSIRRYSTQTWGAEQTERYMADIRDTLKALRAGRVVARDRGDLRSGLLSATSGRHVIFFETDVSRLLVIRILHERMDYLRHLGGE